MSVGAVVDHYEILGVPEHADEAAIEAAYRAGLARVKAGLGSGNPLPPEFLTRLRQAYRTLIDVELRLAYDQLRHGPAESQTERREPTLDTSPMSETSQVVVMGAPTVMSGEPLRFQFVGTGGDYFRIWIVNLVLTVLTLGIYSAWAKVRREQFFHRNTLLAGSGFDYHGKPKAILKGRLIAWSLLALMAASKNFNMALYGFLILCSIPILPWLLLRSLKFRAANTSYRGLRFHHRGTYGQAFIAFVAHGIPAFVTGIWMPMWMRAVKRFQLDNLSYGASPFKSDPEVRGFFGTYFKAGLLMILPVAIFVAMVASSIASRGTAGAGALAILMPVGIVLTFSLLVRPYVQVRLANLTWNATSLSGRSFISTQSYGSYLSVVVGNFLMLVLTLGLYWPWAKVREAAYRLEHLAMEDTDLNRFASLARSETSAVGEEIADAFDLDFSL